MIKIKQITADFTCPHCGEKNTMMNWNWFPFKCPLCEKLIDIEIRLKKSVRCVTKD